MPHLPEADVVAILCSDLHLSHRPPRARAGSVDWYTIQGWHLDRLRMAQARYRCPILCAGDVFDTWQSPPELVNWVIDRLPRQFGFYAIPGQHDLPNHSLHHMHRSAYETLVRAGVLVDLTPAPQDDSAKTDIEVQGGWLQVWAYPWGCPVRPQHDEDASGHLRVALVHDYCWRGPDTAYPGASPAKQLTSHRAALAGYDVACFGDNHKPFLAPGKMGQCTIFNHGGFIARTTAERDHRPALGLLCGDGSVLLWEAEPDPPESWAGDVVQGVAPGVDLGDFIQGCRVLGTVQAPFLEQLGQAADRHPLPSVGQLVHRIREECVAKRGSA